MISFRWLSLYEDYKAFVDIIYVVDVVDVVNVVDVVDVLWYGIGRRVWEGRDRQIIQPPNFQKGVEQNPCLWREFGVQGSFTTA